MANHPIFAPTFYGDLKRVRTILKAEPSAIAVRSAKNLTPLHAAASRGKHKVARLLLDNGADVTGPTGRHEWTPLVYAAYRGHYDAACVLIEYGAGVTAKDGNPIHFAGQRKHKELCRLLVQHGAVDNLVRSKDTNVIDLFRAAYSYDSEAVDRILSEHPKLVNRKDKLGRTPMHEACTNGDVRTVRTLLKHGGDPDLADRNGQTSRDRAVAHNQRAIVKIFESER